MTGEQIQTGQPGGTPQGENAPHPHHISPWKVILVVLLLAGVVVVVGLRGYLPREEQRKAAVAVAEHERDTLPLVTVVKVKRAAEDTEVALPGTISALSEASIFARAAGYVRKRYVDIGDHVREGQQLAEIETPELDQQVAQSKAAVSQAQQQLGQTRASLVQSQAQRDLAKKTFDRYVALVDRGAVARQDADQQEATYKSAQAVVDSQEANIRAAEENVRQAQANLDRVTALQEYKNVRAPMSGVITARNIEVGSLISASGAGQGLSPMSMGGGAPAAGGYELYRVAQTGTVRILVSVPQTAAPGIVVGMPVQIRVNEFLGRTFPAKVTRTTNSLDPASRTMLTEVQLPNPDGKLLPGMYAEVHFRSHRDNPPLLVPGEALIAANSGLQVATIQDGSDGTKMIHLVPVEAGRDFGSQTEILSGLAADQTIVVNPGDDVRENASVRIQAAAGRGGAPPAPVSAPVAVQPKGEAK